MTGTEPDADFDDVVAALAGTALAPGPRGVDAIASALAAPAVPERVRGIEAAIERDADEAWSLATAFLDDEEAAWQAVVGGFLALGRGDCAALSRADALRAQAAAALDVWRLMAKAGATREVPGSALPPEVRLGLLLRGGLRERDLALDGAPDLAAALAALHPRPGHAQGDELCRLVARELLDALEPEQAATLAALRRSHPTSALLLRERYAEVVEVPLLVMPRQDELLTTVRAQLALEEEQRARSGSVRLRITVSCCFCHDRLSREDAVFCAGCLAPHHEECFMTHGHCSAAGCGQTRLVRPDEAPPAAVRPSGRRRALGAAFGALLLASAGVAAWSQGLLDGRRDLQEEEQEEHVIATDPAVLREAEARTAAAQAQRERTRAAIAAITRELEAQRITVDFDETPFLECVAHLREVTKRNIVVSGDAHDLIETQLLRVSLRLRDVAVTDVLNLVVATHSNLTCRFAPGLIRIETTDSDREELLLEVYDVADVISGAARDRGGFHLDPDELIRLLELCPAVLESQYSAEVSNGTLVMRTSETGLAQAARLLDYLSGAQPESATASEPGWVQGLKARFERPTTLNFQETPLAEVVSVLQDLTGANITVSPAVDQEETTVNLQVRDLPLHEALRLILEQTNLASAFRNETLMICPPEDARGELRLRIFDTRDLEAWLDPEVLEGVVTRGVGENAWDDPAWIRNHHQQLLVHQTDEVHAAIDQILAKLRVSRARNQAGQGR